MEKHEKKKARKADRKTGRWNAQGSERCRSVSMRDSDNLNDILGNLPIENEVASGTVFAIARPNVATVLASEGLSG